MGVFPATRQCLKMHVERNCFFQVSVAVLLCCFVPLNTLIKVVYASIEQLTDSHTHTQTHLRGVNSNEEENVHKDTNMGSDPGISCGMFLQGCLHLTQDIINLQ